MMNETNWVDVSQTNAIVSHSIPAETPQIKMAENTKNNHAIGTLNSGSWCPSCHKLLLGDVLCDSDRCSEQAMLTNAFAEHTVDRSNRLSVYSEREVDDRMRKLYDEILNIKHTLLDSKRDHDAVLNSKRMMILTNLKN